ncbi:MAG: hypothetical protein U0Q55_17155 [Vicinamibacterales bacterium]
MPMLRRAVRAGAWLACLLLFSAPAVAQPARPSLRIVVIEGEDAVNIIQQRTAVAPVVEVRDRNDQPVAGAIVRFAIRTGRGSFGGARTLAVSTNAAGRATALGFVPESAGPMQIAATASFQGQTAAITITQTNVLTAAQAAAGGGAAAGSAGGTTAVAGGAAGGAAAAGAAGAGGAAAGAGAAAGIAGGLSTTTLVIAGAAAAGGAYAVKTAVDKAGELTGTYDFQWDRVFRNNQVGALGCSYTVRSQGTAHFIQNGSGTSFSATFGMDGTEGIIAGTCANVVGSSVSWGRRFTLTGSESAFSGSDTSTGSFPGGTIVETETVSGSLAGGVATITVTKSDVVSGAADTGRGTGTTTITLR